MSQAVCILTSIHVSLPVILGYVSFFLAHFVDYLIIQFIQFPYAERKQIKEELEDQYKSILDKNAQEMEDMKKTFEEKLKEAEQKGVILNAYTW